MKSSNIGGQAVMEGIMMRHKDKYAIAVRRPDKEIELKVEDYKCTFGKAAFLKWPIIRGVVSFVDGLVVGTKCLMYSAEIAGDEEDEKEAAKNATLTEEELSAKKAKEAKQFQWLLYITVAISIVVSVAAFMLLPYALASLLRKVGASEVGVTVAEAFVKLALFMGYMLLISRMKDIQRTFMYHGAEHKCINCVEHGLPLTVENVLASSRQHKRCGTSFLFLVMIVSIFLHFIFVLVPGYWVRLFGRLLMVPIVSGVSFELIQWAGRTDSRLADILSKPGLAMQKLTTKEPTADMAEVAIAAVEAVFDWREYLKEEFGWKPEENEEKMRTYKEVLEDGIQLLETAAIEEARLDAWLLLEYTADITRAWYYAHMDDGLDAKTEERYRTLCTKRAQHIPLQHITGRAYFMGYEFCVDERVLVPRQDTEVLVEEAISRMRNLEKPQILDMCTGSGCILLSLLLELPQALGTGVDVSEGALCVAKENRKRLGLEQRADLIQSDLFSADYFQKNSGNDHMEYDMLISNPPYIRTEDIEGLMEEVRFHDPVLALDGKENGLYFYEKITEQAGTYLKPGGWLMYEIGCDQGMDVSEIMKKNGFEQIEIKKDLAGLDRVVTGRKMQEEQNV